MFKIALLMLLISTTALFALTTPTLDHTSKYIIALDGAVGIVLGCIFFKAVWGFR